MPFHFWLVLAFCVIVFYLLRPPKPAPQPEPIEAKFFGGPFDGKTVRVLKLEDFFIQQYMPDEDEATVIGEMLGQKVYAPNFAYYTHISDADYLYKRDVAYEDIPAILEANGLIDENGKPRS